MGLVRDRMIGVSGLKDVDRYFVTVRDLLPTDEKIRKESSGIGHLIALKGVLSNVAPTLAGQCEPHHTRAKGR